MAGYLQFLEQKKSVSIQELICRRTKFRIHGNCFRKIIQIMETIEVRIRWQLRSWIRGAKQSKLVAMKSLKNPEKGTGQEKYQINN
jgi:hypothetical protein